MKPKNDKRKGNKMKKFIVVQDCFCEGYLHERFNYNRSGLVEKKLIEDDVVEFVNEWSNVYGTYYTVRKGNETYDIPPGKLIEITEKIGNM